MPRPKAAPAATAPGALAEPTAPRFAALWAALVYALCTLALTYPVFAGQFLVSPHSDQYIAGYAFRDFAAQALRSGQGIPNWNPYLFGGMPYIAAMHGDIFYPTFLLRMVMRTDLAMTWEFAIHLFLAGVFTYGFLRAWRMRFFPSLLGGVAYMLAGQIASYASPGHDGKLFVSALLPAALWMLTRGIRDGRHYAWGVLAIVVGLAVLSPHPQLLQYMLLACGAWALYLAFGTYEDGTKLDRAVAIRRLGLALAAVVIGGAIGAVQFLPVREYVAWSPRAGGRGYDYATTYSFPIEELFNTYLPQFTGMLDNYWGRNSIHLHSEYLGVIVLMLAFAGLWAANRSSFRWFWVGTLIVSLLWALGGNTPFYHIVYALVPGSKFFRAPSTIFYITSFSFAVLAALGTERLLRGEIRPRYAYAWLGFGAVVALLASTGALTGVASSIGNSIGNYIAQSYPAEQHDAVVNAVASQVADRAAANNGALILGAWRSFFFVLVGAALVIATWRRMITGRVVAWALVLVTAVDLWSIARDYWIFSPPAKQLYATDAAIEAIRKGPPGRVIAEGFGPGIAPRDPYFGGSGLMVHDVRSLTGYHGNELGRYQKLLGYTPGTRPSDQRVFNPEVWRHENVRYLYTNVDQPDVDRLFTQAGLPHATKIAGPVKNAAGSTVYAYRIDADNPLAWVAPVMVKASDDQALPTVIDPRYDQSRVAIVDTAATVPTAQLTTLPPAANIPVTIAKYAPGEIVAQLASPAPQGSALVVSENYYPGWRAMADGKDAPTVRADYNLIGVALPAGAREVRLSFLDPAYPPGKTITWIALALAVLATAGGVVAWKRRPVPAP